VKICAYLDVTKPSFLMKKKITKLVIYFFFIALADTVSVAQTADKELIAQALEEFRNAMVNPDSKILAALASDDLEYVHSSGTVRDKQGFIDEFVKRWTNFTKVTFQDQTIKVSGDNAIVRHRLLADANNPGYPSKVDIIILMVWRKENAEWKMLARQAAKIP
jgi:ketosteroid isomerase-like protein